MDNLTEIITIVGGVLGTAGIWKFAEARLRLKAEQKKKKHKTAMACNTEMI